ncbi:hypothetical protein COK19_12770 [Bacillus cereus]|uniref:DUF2726 domain-containing protein n=1 Tax=Bacillus cereus TaxID=1396 RepID=UPI000BF93903|nr:DUF2726 domain-containing protein [Bacillus cereus]PFR26493.1 hypothetical protein COK19_12770 [Bacillus cereus]
MNNYKAIMIPKDLADYTELLASEITNEEKKLIIENVRKELPKLSLENHNDFIYINYIVVQLEYYSYLLENENSDIDEIQHLEKEFTKEDIDVIKEKFLDYTFFVCKEHYRNGFTEKLQNMMGLFTLEQVKEIILYNYRRKTKFIVLNDYLYLLFEYIKMQDDITKFVGFNEILYAVGMRVIDPSQTSMSTQVNCLISLYEKLVELEPNKICRDIYHIRKAMLQDRNAESEQKEIHVSVWDIMMIAFFETVKQKQFVQNQSLIEQLFLDAFNQTNYIDLYVPLLLDSSFPIYKKKFLKNMLHAEQGIVQPIFQILDKLYEKKEYKLVASFYENSSTDVIQRFQFQFAFSLEYIGNWKEAKNLYESYKGEDSAVYNNLGVIYRDHLNELEKALELFQKAQERNSDSKVSKDNLDTTQKMIEEKKREEEERPKIMKEAYFKKTKPWHKKVLFSLYFWEAEEDFNIERLATITKTASETAMRNLEYVKSLGMISIQARKIIFDPTIEELVRNWVAPELQSEVVRTSGNICFQPIFYHESEKRLYRALIELFPQHLVFPNMSLQTIFSYEKIKDLVDNETFTYYLRTHVDFVVVNTTSYLPIIAFEKDSDYHDQVSQKEKDKMKDLIFESGGIPLVRLRFNNALDLEELKTRITEKTKQLLLHYHGEESLYARALFEQIDTNKFGLDFQPISKEEFKVYWEKIVGNQIATQTIITEIKDGIVYMKLEKGLQPIMEMMYTTLCAKVIKEFPNIKDIQIEWIS